MTRLLGVLGMCAALAACAGNGGLEDDSPDPLCTPGTVRRCPCPNDTEGLQQCADDGRRFLECTQCNPGAGSSSSASGASSGAPSVSSSSSGGSGPVRSSSTGAGPAPAPTVLSVEPVGGARITPFTSITVRFSRGTTLSEVTLSGSLVDAATSTWSATRDSVVLAPSGVFWPEGALLLQVRLMDTAGALADVVSLAWDVSGDVPQVLGASYVEPPMPLPNGASIAPNRAIMVRFSKRMDVASLSLGGSMATEGTVAWAGAEGTAENVLVLSPTATWSGPTPTLTVQARDLHGNPLPMPWQASYLLDVSAPTVTAVTALDPVGMGQMLVFQLSEPVQRVELEGTLVQQGFLSDVNTQQQLVLVPLSTWLPGMRTLTVRVWDAAHTEGSGTFTIRVDPTRTGVTSVVPDRGYIEDAGQTLQVTFDRAVVQATETFSGTPPERFANRQWNNASDTLTIQAPPDGWMEGETFVLTVRDVRGVEASVPFTARVALLADLPRLTVPIRAYKVEDDNGGRSTRISATEFARWVDEANRTYAAANIRFTFDPGADFVPLQSTLINSMGGVSDPFWPQRRAAAEALVQQNPGKLIAFARWGPDAAATGGGFSWTDYGFIATPGFQELIVCGEQAIGLVAHELGHQFGLGHTHTSTYNTVAEAAAAFTGDAQQHEGDAMTDTPPDPFIHELQCSPDTTVTLGATTFRLNRSNVMSYWNGAGPRLTVQQAMRARQGVLVRAVGSTSSLLPYRGIGIGSTHVEAESLAASGTTNASANAQNMAGFFGRWSGGSQLFVGGGSAGTFFETTLAASGQRNLWVVFTGAPDFGVVQVTVNGQPTAQPVNLYAPFVLNMAPVDLGPVLLGNAVNRIRFTVVGKDARSTGHAMGVDLLTLQ